MVLFIGPSLRVFRRDGFFSAKKSNLILKEDKSCIKKVNKILALKAKLCYAITKLFDQKR